MTLWFGKSKGKPTKKLEVDNKKIKLVSKNVFNITNLTTQDHGWYTCQVCGKKRAKFLEVPDQGTKIDKFFFHICISNYYIPRKVFST